MDLIERTQAALEGIGDRPWRMATNRHPNCDGSQWGWIDGVVGHWTWTDEKPFSRAQAEFIAAARTLVPELLAALIEARREVNDLSGAQADVQELWAENQELKAKVRRLEGDS